MDFHKIMLIVWAASAVLFLVGELLTEGFALAWFGIGAAVAAILALLKLPLWLQLVAFGVISGVLFLLSRTIFKRLTKKAPSSGVGSERLTGRIGVVVEPIDPMTDRGLVRVYKEEWRADSIDQKPVKAGIKVAVVEIDGFHLVVAPIIGQVAKVVERIDPATDKGKVRIYNITWRATSADNKPLGTGLKAEITDASGANLVVKLKEE